MNDADLLDALYRRLMIEVPGFQIKEKRVWWWWAIYYVSFMWIWQPNFMESYWTTIGRKAYMPYASKFGYEVYGDYATLWHEHQHVIDLIALQKRLEKFWGPLAKPLGSLLWSAGYGFPQVLALGALAASWGSLWWLLCLVALAPWPAPFRERIELRGYAASLEAWADIRNRAPNNLDDQTWIAGVVDRNFMGMGYWKMSWDKKPVQLYFADVTKRLTLAHAEGKLLDNVT